MFFKTVTLLIAFIYVVQMASLVVSMPREERAANSSDASSDDDVFANIEGDFNRLLETTRRQVDELARQTPEIDRAVHNMTVELNAMSRSVEALLTRLQAVLINGTETAIHAATETTSAPA